MLTEGLHADLHALDVAAVGRAAQPPQTAADGGTAAGAVGITGLAAGGDGEAVPAAAGDGADRRRHLTGEVRSRTFEASRAIFGAARSAHAVIRPAVAVVHASVTEIAFRRTDTAIAETERSERTGNGPGLADTGRATGPGGQSVEKAAAGRPAGGASRLSAAATGSITAPRTDVVPAAAGGIGPARGDVEAGSFQPGQGARLADPIADRGAAAALGADLARAIAVPAAERAAGSLAAIARLAALSRRALLVVGAARATLIATAPLERRAAACLGQLAGASPANPGANSGVARLVALGISADRAVGVLLAAALTVTSAVGAAAAGTFVEAALPGVSCRVGAPGIQRAGLDGETAAPRFRASAESTATGAGAFAAGAVHAEPGVALRPGQAALAEPFGSAAAIDAGHGGLTVLGASTFPTAGAIFADRGGTADGFSLDTGPFAIAETFRHLLVLAETARQAAGRVGSIFGTASQAVAVTALTAGAGRVAAADSVFVLSTGGNRGAFARSPGCVAGDAGTCTGDVATDAISAKSGLTLRRLVTGAPQGNERAAGDASATGPAGAGSGGTLHIAGAGGSHPLPVLGRCGGALTLRAAAGDGSVRGAGSDRRNGHGLAGEERTGKGNREQSCSHRRRHVPAIRSFLTRACPAQRCTSFFLAARRAAPIKATRRSRLTRCERRKRVTARSIFPLIG
jgi:hypothetical protein